MARGIMVGSRWKTPSPGTNSVTKTVTLAQLNAGHTIVKGFGAVRYRVVDFLLLMNGTFATATDIRLSDTASTPVDIATIAIANAEDNAQIGPQTVDVPVAGTENPKAVLGAGWAAKLGAGQGIQIRKTGSAATGGTDILVTIQYEIASGVYAETQAA